MPTIAEIASGPDFTILLDTILFIDSEIPEAGLAAALSGSGPFTVFAPNNAAFGTLAADLGFTGDTTDTAAVTTFLTTNVDAATLRAVVEYHVIAGAKSSTEIAASETLTTLQGGTITPDVPTLVDNEPDLIDPSLVATDIAADNGVVHVIDRVLLPVDLPGNDAPTFTEIVIAESGATGFDTDGSDFDMLREALIAADLAGTLDNPDLDLTVFAPTDAGFIALSQGLGYDGSDEAGALTYLLDSLRLLSKGGDPIDLLTTVLTYHVGVESLQASQVLTGDPIQTVEGGTFFADGTTLVDNDPDLPDPNIIATDIQAANGVLHVLDGVLIPTDLLVSTGANDVDFVIADDGRNRIVTGRDNDYIDAKSGKDYVAAGRGDDVVLAGAGHDLVLGGRGDDHILGEAGRDKLFGNKGDDTIAGGTGDDLLFGGFGNDTFVIEANAGKDRIFDFGLGDDKIDLSALELDNGYEDLHIFNQFFRTIVNHDEGQIIVYGLHDLGADDFIF